MTDDIIESTHVDFLENRTVIINGEINSKLIEGLVMQIVRWNSEDNALDIHGAKSYKREDHPISIYINSRGGAVYDGLSAVSAIVTSKTPVYTYALGEVLSAAFVIFIVGHKRFSQPYSTFMFHDCICGGQGKTQERKESLYEQEKYSLILQGIVKKYTKIQQKMIDKIIKEKLDKFWLAPEALKLNIFDKYW